MQNLVCRTDAIFHRRDGFIEEFPTHWVIRTPSNPSFWFGNYILFRNAPQPADLATWLGIHAAAFSLTLNHITLGWDLPEPGEIQQFLDVGFRASHGISLSMSSYEGEVTINPNLQIRPLQTDAEWEAMVAQQIRIDSEDFHYPEDAGTFRRQQMVSSREMAQEGRGDWWGAFLGLELVGGMGLYFDEAQTIGRFQYVTTDSRHRRQRVCTTLLDHIVRYAFSTVDPEVLVISTDAEETNHAIPTYRNFGFKDAMRSYAVTRLSSATPPAA
jgi:GNAT superfamily N-acetyltransferase